MLVETEAIVLRQTKAVNGRRMLTLFTPKYGKISVGTSVTEGGKNKSALFTRPFTRGKYELYKGKETYNLNSGQVLDSFYSLGENVDKYLAASYVLELTDKLLIEEIAQPRLYSVLWDFLKAMEKREKKQDTLVCAFIVKALDIMGVMPVIGECACSRHKAETGPVSPTRFFSIKEGGMICAECAKTIALNDATPLIYDTNFGIVNILSYFRTQPFSSFEKIALDEAISAEVDKILKSYMNYHLDIGKLKSEAFRL